MGNLPTCEEPAVSLRNTSDSSYDYLYYYGYMYYDEVQNDLPDFHMGILYIALEILPVLMAAVAFFGNTLIIITLLLKKNRVFSTSALFISLAVADLMASVSATLLDWVMNKVDIKNLNMDIDCKMRMFAIDFGKLISSLIRTAITIERTLAVFFPHKIKLICSPSIIKVSLFILWTMGFGFTLFASIQSEAVFADGFIFCNPTPDDSLIKYFGFVHPLLEFLFNFLLPIIIIVIGSVAILLKLYARVDTMSKLRKKEFRNIFYTVVIINTFFVLLKLPYFIYNVTTWILIVLKCEDIDPMVNYFWNTICHTLDDMNHAVNFFIYFWTGIQFRNDVKTMLYNLTKKCRNVR